MKIKAIEDDDLREGDEFRFTNKPNCKASSTFIAVRNDEVVVTRRFSNLENLPDDTPVIAHWHGQYRTEGFQSTIGALKKKAVTSQ